MPKDPKINPDISLPDEIGSSNKPAQTESTDPQIGASIKEIIEEASGKIDVTESSTQSETDAVPVEKPKHPFQLAQEKYKDIPLHEANRRFKNEFLTWGRENSLKYFAGDMSLSINLEDEKTCPTAYIEPDTGKIRISKSIALACIDGKRDYESVFNYPLLTFIILHEIGHFLDLRNPDKKKVFLMPQELEEHAKWMERLNDRIWDKWEKDFVPKDDPTAEPYVPVTPEERLKKSTSLHHLYHQFTNSLDDCIVNATAMRSPETRNLDISKIYREVLFTEIKYDVAETPRCMQLGYYILQKIMNPQQEIEVDEDVKKELDRIYPEIKIDKKGGKTLLELMEYLVYKHDLIYAAKRYKMYYLNEGEKFFISALERLIDLDLKDKKKRDKLKKEMEKMAEQDNQNKGENGDQKQEQSEGESEGKGGGSNPFADDINRARKAKKSAEGAVDEKRTQEKEENKEGNKTDSERRAENAKKEASNFASSNNLDQDKTQRYFDVLAEKREDIERLADFITAILLRNKTESTTILEKRKKSGNLSVKDLIRNYPDLIAGESTYSTKVFERNVLSERYQARSIGLKLRLLIDNSGSMGSLIGELEEIFVIVSNAMRLANFKLETLYGQKANLNTEMILFGNAKTEGVENSGGRRIKGPDSTDDSDDTFHSNLIKAFSRITCNEGTDDSDAWKRISEEWFSPEEVKVEGEDENISIAMELTDGFVFNPKETEIQVKASEAKGINCSCIYFENRQALDKSVSDIMHETEEKFHQKISQRGNLSPEEMRKSRDEYETELKKAMETYKTENAELKKANPSGFWGDKMIRLSRVKDILPILMFNIMSEVNKVDETLGKEVSYSLETHKQALSQN